jgi:hypothetical protein
MNRRLLVLTDLASHKLAAAANVTLSGAPPITHEMKQKGHRRIRSSKS